MLDTLVVSIVEKVIADGVMNTDRVQDALDMIGEARMKLDALSRSVKNACLHKDKDGKRTTNATGGGMAQCRVCGSEID